MAAASFDIRARVANAADNTDDARRPVASMQVASDLTDARAVNGPWPPRGETNDCRRVCGLFSQLNAAAAG
jgi:hypothetical protein